jgi:hypothetical protein
MPSHLTTVFLATACLLTALAHLHAPPVLILAAYALLFIPYALLSRATSTHGGDDPRRALLTILAIGATARLLLLTAEPLLSDDIWRYVWDGRVTLSGINPFLYPPDADQLAHLRDAHIWPRINHAHIPTIYPPASQLVFALNAAIGGADTSLRALLLLIEAASCTLIYKNLTHDRPHNPAALTAAALYYLNPLVIIETAWSGHLDVIAWSTLAAALTTFTHRGSTRSGIATAALIATSVAAKLLSVIALPLLLFYPKRPLRQRLASATACVAFIAALYAPFASPGPAKLFAGFTTYAASWRSNDGPYRLLTHIAQDLVTRALPPDDPTLRLSFLDDAALHYGFTRPWQGQTIPATSFAPNQIAETLMKCLVALLLAILLLTRLRASHREDPTTSMLTILCALLFLAPTVHPWYVAWLVPLAALSPHTRLHRPALVASLVVLLAYTAWLSHHAGGPWSVPIPLLIIEFSAPLLAYIIKREAPCH